jgi:hypothetical protein
LTPPLAHGDTAATVVLIGAAVWLEAALLHRLPDAVLGSRAVVGRLTVTEIWRTLAFPAAAIRGCAAREIIGRYVPFCPATTAAQATRCASVAHEQTDRRPISERCSDREVFKALSGHMVGHYFTSLGCFLPEWTH